MARRGYRYKRYYGKNRKKFIGPLLPGGYAKGNAKKLARRWRWKRYRNGYKSKYKGTMRSGYYRAVNAYKWKKRLDLFQYAMGGTMTFRINYVAEHVLTAGSSSIASLFLPHPGAPTGAYGGIFSATTNGTGDNDARTMDHYGMLGDAIDKYAWFRPMWMKTVCVIKTTAQQLNGGHLKVVLRAPVYGSSSIDSVENLLQVESTQRHKMGSSRYLNGTKTAKLTIFTRFGYKNMPTMLQNAAATAVSNYIAADQKFLYNETIANISGAWNFPCHQLVCQSSANGFGIFSNGQSMGVSIHTYHTIHCKVYKGVNRSFVEN